MVVVLTYFSVYRVSLLQKASFSKGMKVSLDFMHRS
ncbi:protein of unknown function [Pseudomonas mediterranea]